MRFFHLGDLHFGKMLYNVQMTDRDQPYWVDRFLEAVDQWNPDAVVIAGDVYDRRVPSPEAMQLFDHFLTELARRDKYVLIIPGNHDSAIRLSHVNELLVSHRIYIAGKPRRDMLHVTVPGGDCPAVFWLMPYIFPKLVSDKDVLDDETITTYDAAARALLGAQPVDPSACNVLIAHQNVLANGVAPEHSDSETIIGGLGEIESEVFDGFDYVALGHIHNAQKVGRETIRYSGCPLYYDFSEIKRSKALTMVDIRSKGDIEVTKVEIPLLHELKQVSGTLDELIDQGMKMENRDHYYIQAVITDKSVPSGAMEQLRAVYGSSLLNVKRDNREIYADSPGAQTGENMTVSLSLEEQFGMFFKSQMDELEDGTQEELIRRILEQQERNGDTWISDYKAVPQADSQELADFLIQQAKEAEE